MPKNITVRPPGSEMTADIGRLKAIARGPLAMIPSQHETPVAYAVLARRLGIVPDIVDLALVGGFAWDVAGILAGQYIKEGEAMPEELEQYVVHRLTGVCNRPGKSGKSALASFFRNAMIKAAVNLVLVAQEGGIKKTRNDVSKNKISALEVVSIALIESGHAISYEAVKKIHLAPLFKRP